MVKDISDSYREENKTDGISKTMDEKDIPVSN
jgi:hypothetical protein